MYSNYEFDRTASSPNNLVVNEVHVISNATALTIVAENGLFYTSTLIVANVSNPNVPYVAGIDYSFQGFDPFITADTGYECASAISFNNTSISGSITMQYQAVGGIEGSNSGLVIQLQNAIAAIGSQTHTWAQVQNKPIAYPPLPHQHNLLTDLTGLNALTNVLCRIEYNLSSARLPSLSSNNLEAQINRLLALLTIQRQDINSIATKAVTNVFNKLAVGTPSTNPLIGLYNVLNDSDTSANSTFANYNIVSSSNVSGTGNKIGAYGIVQAVTGYAGTGALIGVDGNAQQSAAVNVTELVGVNGSTTTITSGTIGVAIGFQSSMSFNAASTVNNIYGLNIGAIVGANTTNTYGILINDISNSTSSYGLYSGITSGTNKFNLYVAGTAPSYFAGKVNLAGGATLPGLGNYANDAAAAIGGVPVNGIYRNGSVLMVRVS